MNASESVLDLSLAELEVDRSSYVDPQGFLFAWRGDLYRALCQRREFYLDLLESGYLADLSASHQLVECSRAPLTIAEIGCDLVIHHPRISPVSYCHEWCPSMLQRAATLTLQLNLELLERNCILQDSYPFNVLFVGCRPVFVDLTSIVPIETRLIWPAYQQYQNFFLNPLRLSSCGKSEIARLLLSGKYIDGLETASLLQNLPLRYVLRHPMFYAAARISVRLAASLQRKVARKVKLQKAVNRLRVDNELRRRFFRNLLKKTERLRFAPGKSAWSEYYCSLAPAVRQEDKTRTVARLLDRFQPRTVLDLGANTGRFSLLAARKGARVTAVDTSADAMEILFLEAEKENLLVLPLIMDVLNPTPSFGFMASQFPSFVERGRSDMVLCLGLMHHLHINGRQSFERIAQLLATLAQRVVLFEYVDVQDGNIHLLDHGRPINYTLPEVSRHLERYFRLEMFPSDRQTRTLILCEKK